MINEAILPQEETIKDIKKTEIWYTNICVCCGKKFKTKNTLMDTCEKCLEEYSELVSCIYS